MIWKLALTLLLLGLVWAFLFRSKGKLPHKKRQSPKKNDLKGQDLIKCHACGIYLPAGQTCDCSDRD